VQQVCSVSVLTSRHLLFYNMNEGTSSLVKESLPSADRMFS
jgi:hypothetical protein